MKEEAEIQNLSITSADCDHVVTCGWLAMASSQLNGLGLDVSILSHRLKKGGRRRAEGQVLLLSNPILSFLFSVRLSQVEWRLVK